jgi:predicted DNA-binding protein (UPF0251 family)
MIWSPSVPELSEEEFWELAQRVCTEREVEALRLKSLGFSERSAAKRLGISRSSFGDRLDSAERKLLAAMRSRSI